MHFCLAHFHSALCLLAHSFSYVLGSIDTNAKPRTELHIFVFLQKRISLTRLESSACAPKNFGAHFKTLVRECNKIGAQSA